MSTLPDLRRAFATGDLAAVRNNIAALDDESRRLLEQRLGPSGLRRLERTARRSPGRREGRVIVINGIMGSLLDAVKDGDADRVWVNFFRLAGGRIADFRCTDDGTPADGDISVVVAGLHDTYLPMVLELDRRWHVQPFPFDWRLDVDESARRLAACVREFGAGEPVHIVAHSMGGIVARRMIQKFPDVWAQMDDGDGHRRGGRLAMLGTPNRGSYVIPLLLTGKEKLVRMLALVDLRHSLARLLEIIATFPGSYQMLPSPRSEIPDDHDKLFRPGTWGDLPVSARWLRAGRRFQSDLEDVVDPDRFLYVAGYDQRTPCCVRVEAPGEFRYGETLDGDGRVPHALGLLEGVRTFWVAEAHGDLPRNEHVLRDIHGLLERGEATVLQTGRRAARSIPTPAQWLPPEAVEPLPADFDASRARRAAGTAKETPEDAAREMILLGDYVGHRAAGGAAAPAAGARAAAPASAEIPFAIEVVWGDIARINADVTCVGHYENVLPQNAELAVDRAISPPGADPRDLVLTDLTRRRVLSGHFGDVNFFPWPHRGRRRRHAAIAGMGRPGEFDGAKLRVLARGLAAAIGRLPEVQTISTVLIGSGEGGLTLRQALRLMLLGVADAIAEGGLGESVRTLRLVEYSKRRAGQIQEALDHLRKERTGLSLPKAGRTVREARGGTIGWRHGLALALAATASGRHARAGSRARRAADVLLAAIPAQRNRRLAAQRALDDLGDIRAKDLDGLADRFRIEFEDTERPALAQPARIGYDRDGDVIRVAAITNTATIPQRELSIDFELVDELTERSTDPDAEDAASIGDLLVALLVHRDFEALLRGGEPLVIEVDREMAAIHWEMLPGDRLLGDHPHVALQRPVVRQLRTTYSPPPMHAGRGAGPLRALVIGDAGDPEEGDALPGARREARDVARRLERAGCSVTALIGAPDEFGRGPVAGVEPASRLETLRHLLLGGYDIVHYCGHGDFDPDDPTRVGWVFKGGLITPGEIEGMRRPPRVIVANACLTGRTSAAFRGGASLLPSLADEFFRRGVHNYIGTAWEVSDAGAVLFARTLYDSLFGEAGEDRTLGAALLAARRALYAKRERYHCLWAAYQHYGDPHVEVTRAEA